MKIVVAIRKRPLTKREVNKSEKDIVDIHEPHDLVLKELR